MKKINKRLFALALAMVMVFGSAITTNAQESLVTSQSEDTLVSGRAIDYAPFYYYGDIANARNWSSKYSMRAGSSVNFRFNVAASAGTSLAVEVFNSSGTSLGIKSYNLVGTSSATFTYGTLSPGSYTYRFIFMSGSGSYTLIFGV